MSSDCYATFATYWCGIRKQNRKGRNKAETGSETREIQGRGRKGGKGSGVVLINEIDSPTAQSTSVIAASRSPLTATASSSCSPATKSDRSVDGRTEGAGAGGGRNET